MPVNCGACGLACTEENTQVKCSGSCVSVFHLNCAKPKTRSARKDWICESCKPDRDSSSSVASSKSSTPAFTKEFFINTLEAFKREMFTELKSRSSEVIDIQDSLKFLSESVDKNNKLLESVMGELKKTQDDNSRLRRENFELLSTLNGLELRVRNMEQHSRRQNVEIDGIPETHNEDVTKVLEDVARAIGVEVKKENIVAAHRVPTYNKKRTPPIIVRFSTYEERDTWISAYKSVRPLTANRINPNLKTTAKVFVNEHLTPENKQFLKYTKEVAKEKGYKFVWCKDGKVFVRRSDGETCKKILLRSDLDKL